jgi:hypothetical protein
MIHIYHHIWKGGTGLQISEQQKNRLFNSITDEFIYHPNVVEINENECHTLIKMLDEIKEFDNEDYILYIHTKGASKPNELYEIEWREYMELSLIDDYKTHIKMLETGYDASGVLGGIEGSFIRFWSGGFYGGNFWWSTVKLLNKIPKNIKELWGGMENRAVAEWCFLNKIENYNPFTFTPSFENFNNFFNHIKEHSNICLSKQYVTKKTYWENPDMLKMKTRIENLEIKTQKTFI